MSKVTVKTVCEACDGTGLYYFIHTGETLVVEVQWLMRVKKMP